MKGDWSFLQRQGENEDAVCEKFIVMNNVSDARGDWIDFVMHAKWTGDPDGFEILGKKKNDAKYFQKLITKDAHSLERRGQRSLF